MSKSATQKKLAELIREGDGFVLAKAKRTVVEASQRGTYILECEQGDFPNSYDARVAAKAPSDANAFVRESGHTLMKLDGSKGIAMEVTYYRIKE